MLNRVGQAQEEPKFFQTHDTLEAESFAGDPCPWPTQSNTLFHWFHNALHGSMIPGSAMLTGTVVHGAICRLPWSTIVLLLLYYHILIAQTQVFYPILSRPYLTQKRSNFSKVTYKSMCQGLHYLKMHSFMYCTMNSWICRCADIPRFGKLGSKR